ncbi:hypothetical protein HYX16_06445 [Candidatus Woesearchaeota archaeon]|nr:hypothetical protein [Candidatus Woesearchaeota archaeon]
MAGLEKELTPVQREFLRRDNTFRYFPSELKEFLAQEREISGQNIRLRYPIRDSERIDENERWKLHRDFSRFFSAMQQQNPKVYTNDLFDLADEYLREGLGI